VSAFVLVVTALVAASVEAVEAFTIVLATGLTRGWRSAVEGSLAALGALTVLVAVFGPGLIRLVPLDVLRLVVGTFLVVFGLQWLRKAVLRAAGLKAKHDEDAIFAREVDRLAGADATPGRDPVGFVTAFKAVFLEGFEVIVIVVALGASSHRLGLVALGALGGIVLVTAVGFAVRKQLARVPENALKTTVGVLITSFGTFWIGEGASFRWPGSDGAVVVLVVLYLAAVAVATATLRRVAGPTDAVPAVTGPAIESAEIPS